MAIPGVQPDALAVIEFLMITIYEAIIEKKPILFTPTGHDNTPIAIYSDI